ncbi:MAG: signal peptidase I [Prevotella sp.]
MKAFAHFIIALAVAALIMLAFRALAFTVCTISGNGLSPEFVRGDRVLVNRWSYGLRTGKDGSLFNYGRICRSEIKRGDIVAFDSPADSLPGVFICRCKAVPGDTVATAGGTVIVPGLINCADGDYYWMESVSGKDSADSRLFGFVPESNIIGRVCMIVYNHDDGKPFYTGYDADRLMLMK